MRHLIFISFLLMPFFSYSQTDYEYEITVIDSFTCYQTAQAGMAGLTAVKYNNQIHLSYIMQDTTGVSRVMYAIENGNTFSTEVITELESNFIPFHPRVVLQFDANGKPNIYYGRIVNSAPSFQRAIFAYRKTAGGLWEGGAVAETGYSPYLVADPDGSEGLGFVFWGPAGNFFSGHITYASYNGTNWDFERLSTREESHRTAPSIVKYDNKIYVSYGEGYCPDTLVTKVHVLENSQWALAHEDINLTTYSCGGINGLYAKIGRTDSGVRLLTSLHRFDGHPYYLKNEGQGWQPQAIDFSASLSAPGWPSPRLKFDAQNTAYWINQSAGAHHLSWIEENGDGGVIPIPNFYGGIVLNDFVIKDGYAHIYYWEGSAAWPYGTPVTFKEIKINLNQFTTGVNDINNKLNFHLAQNYPNPFSEESIIEYNLEKSGQVSLIVYNLLGDRVKTLVNERNSAGQYQHIIYAKDLESGTYFYVLTVNGISSSRQMIIVK